MTLKLEQHLGTMYYDNEVSKEIEEVKRKDPVNHPAHYGQGKIECIDYIEDFLTREEFIGYLRGNIAKYMHRWRYKNKDEDLKKARWYLDRLIATQLRS